MGTGPASAHIPQRFGRATRPLRATVSAYFKKDAVRLSDLPPLPNCSTPLAGVKGKIVYGRLTAAINDFLSLDTALRSMQYVKKGG